MLVDLDSFYWDAGRSIKRKTRRSAEGIHVPWKLIDNITSQCYIYSTVLIEVVRSQIQSIEVAPRSLQGSFPMATAFIEFDTY